MKEGILYLLKSGAVLGFFYLVYRIFLQKNGSLIFNRLFLVSGYITSLLIPAIVVKYNVPLPAIPIEFLRGEYVPEEVAAAATDTDRKFDLWRILWAVYISGMLFIFIKELVTVCHVKSLIKNGRQKKEDIYRIVESRNVQMPFSVFKYIFFNPFIISGKEKEMIIEHEKCHIRQKHWIDLIISECMLILMCFNPFVWLYIKIQKENHEFLGDREVLDKGISFNLYRAVLVKQQLGRPVFSFSNSFCQTNKLNRLKMMEKNKKSPWRKLAAFTAVLPAIAMFLYFTAKPNYVFAQKAASQNKEQMSINGTDARIKIEPSGVTLTFENIFINDVSYTRLPENERPKVIVSAGETEKVVNTPGSSGSLTKDGYTWSLIYRKGENGEPGEIHFANVDKVDNNTIYLIKNEGSVRVDNTTGGNKINLQFTGDNLSTANIVINGVPFDVLGKQNQAILEMQQPSGAKISSRGWIFEQSSA